MYFSGLISIAYLSMYVCVCVCVCVCMCVCVQCMCVCVCMCVVCVCMCVYMCVCTCVCVHVCVYMCVSTYMWVVGLDVVAHVVQSLAAAIIGMWPQDVPIPSLYRAHCRAHFAPGTLREFCSPHLNASRHHWTWCVYGCTRPAGSMGTR